MEAQLAAAQQREQQAKDVSAAAQARADADKKQQAETLEKNRAAAEAKEAEDAACGVSPTCIAKSVCTEIAQRTAANQLIAREKSNPSGVVSLTTLHDLGQDLQITNERIAGLKVLYTTYAHQPFNEAWCPAANAAAISGGQPAPIEVCKRLEGAGVASVCKTDQQTGVKFVVAAARGAGSVTQARDDAELARLVSTFEAEKEARTFVSTKKRIFVAILAADLPSAIAAKVKAVVDAL